MIRVIVGWIGCSLVVRVRMPYRSFSLSCNKNIN